MFDLRNFDFKNENFLFGIAVLICIIFFAAYSVLSIVRHLNYQSFGYDLGINNQLVWRYSTFQLPITTADPFPTETKLAEHVELVYALISPSYWVWSSARMLLLMEAGFICISGMAIYLLAVKRKLHPLIAFALLIGYLAFYGVQNAMWFDVHSASFATAFLAWFALCLDRRKFALSIIFALLAITSKENIGLLTLLISLVYFLKRKDKLTIIIMTFSLAYLLFIYLIFFPNIIHHEYLYQNKDGLLSNLNPLSLVDSAQKREAIFYTLVSFGFVPILLPIMLLPALGDFTTYFVLASDLTASHGIFLHYRVTLAPLMVWATIMTIARFRWLNTKYLAVYFILCTLFVQYSLHLPLSYLTKDWFWAAPSGVKNIELIKKTLTPKDAVVAQNNIVPHISHRDKIYTLYPETKKFATNSPCNQPTCDWFRWEGDAKYLFIDTSPEWDSRHLLTNRDNFIRGLANLEKAEIVTKYKQSGTAVLYIINKQP
jgi:uncharacterized membrane protein